MSEITAAFHEPVAELKPETREIHRALATLTEELEAVDWYQQRIDAAADEELRAILAHNRDEEMEHAAMTLEWLRRRLPRFDEILRTYLFREGSIIAAEEAATGKSGGADGGAGLPAAGLGIGKFTKGSR